MKQILAINHIRYLLKKNLVKFLPPSGKYTSYARNISRLIMFNFGDNVATVLGSPHNTEKKKKTIKK